jgi:hypothetical protein
MERFHVHLANQHIFMVHEQFHHINAKLVKVLERFMIPSKNQRYKNHINADAMWIILQPAMHVFHSKLHLNIPHRPECVMKM